MSVINHKYKYVFLHEPHTGGRSVEKALMAHDDSHNCNGDHHISPLQMVQKGFITALQLCDYSTFRVVRNPYDWLVTCWLRNSRRSDFGDWVLMNPNPFKRDGTLFWKYQDDARFTLRLETIDLEFAFFLDMCEAPRVELEREGVTENKPDWRDLLTISQARQLEASYPDVAKYGYSIFKEVLDV